MSTVPSHFKPWGPILKRAEELDKESVNDPELEIVALYCRKYVVEKSYKTIPSPTCDPFFMQLFEESERSKMRLNSITSDQAYPVCSTHAHNLFARAVKQKDAEEAAGIAASKNTAQLFYKASSMLEILEQFDQAATEEGLSDKRKFAKLAAAEIVRGIQSGSAAAPSATPKVTQAFPSVSTILAAPQNPPIPLPVNISPLLSPAPSPAPIPAIVHSARPPLPINTSMTGVAAAKELIQQCLLHIETGDTDGAQVAMETCLAIRCTNSRIKDAIELSLFAISASKSPTAPKNMKTRFVGDISQLLLLV